jgi:hypothetical protein
MEVVPQKAQTFRGNCIHGLDVENSHFFSFVPCFPEFNSSLKAGNLR